jgi:hypothetical protein
MGGEKERERNCHWYQKEYVEREAVRIIFYG